MLSVEEAPRLHGDFHRAILISSPQDTITGFLLAGLGNIDLRKTSNYLMVDGSESRPPSI